MDNLQNQANAAAATRQLLKCGPVTLTNESRLQTLKQQGEGGCFGLRREASEITPACRKHERLHDTETANGSEEL